MADVELDSLELQITSDAKNAQAGLDALIGTLDRLKQKTKGGVGLTAVANQVGRLAAEAGKLNGSEGAKLESLAKGLQALSNLGSLKLSPSIANQVTAIGNAVKNLDGANVTQFTSLSTGLAALGTIGKNNLNSLLNQLERIPTVAEKLEKADLTTFTKRLHEMAQAMASVVAATESSSGGLSAFLSTLNQVVGASSKISGANRKSELSFRRFTRGLAATWLTLRKVGSVIGSWIAESNDYNENMNLFTVSMGEYTKNAMDYANEVSNAMGINPSEWLRNQGVFMTLGKGFGIAGGRANHMSQQLTQLGYDLSSFYNINVEEAMDKLKSGFSGELEPLRNLGYDLSQAKLQAVALSLGIDKSVSSMTQAEKAELRYMAIMEQVTWVQGDMARTLDEPANMLRVLSAQAKQAAQALGNIFIPTLKAILPWAIAAMKVIRILANAVAGLFGYEFQEPDYSAMENLGSSASGASDAIGEAASNAGKLRKMLLGIDELNVMSDSSGSGSDSGSYGGGGFDFALASYKEDFINDSVSKQIDEITEKMKKWLGITGEITSWADLFKTKLGGILIVAGLIAVAFVAWKIVKGVMGVAETLSKVKGLFGVGKTGGASGNPISELTPKLKNLVKDLGLIIVVIAEVAAAAALIVGAIWLLGVELEQVGIAWEPVIANGETVAIAMGIGTGILAAVGLLTYGLGTVGKDMVVSMALGVAVLAEVGVAAALFIAEIWAIGWGLEQIGEAWQPVLDNGESIATAIGVGTGILVAIGVVTGLLGVATTATAGALPLAIGLGTLLLAEMGVATLLFIAEIWAIGKGLDEVGQAWKPVLDNGETIESAIAKGAELLIAIGVVTAALGVASVASVGTLPLAIGLGTTLLVKLGDSFIEFTDSLIEVANQLSDDLHPAFVDTNAKLPTLSRNMENFTNFMKDFAQKVVDYTKVGVISGIAGTVDKAVDFFTEDPVKRLADEVEDQGDKMQKLVDRLNEVNPIIRDADRLMNEFNNAMKGLKATTGVNGTTPGSIGYTITIGVQLAKSGWTTVKDWIGDLTAKLQIKLPTVNVNWESSGGANTVSIPKFSVKYYAKGGYPDMGQMFVANEAGPELVGTIGNRTAVVNNDQIVESVSRGVYQAVVSAMGSSGGDRVVEAKVNDKVLFEVLVSRARQETVRTGHNPLLGGV